MSEFKADTAHLVLVPKETRSYSISQKDWKRLRKSVANIGPNSSHYHGLGYAAIGVACSTLLALLSLLATEKVPTFVWICAFTVLGISIAVSILCLLFHSDRAGDQKAGADDVLEQMDDMISGMEEPDVSNAPEGKGQA